MLGAVLGVFVYQGQRLVIAVSEREKNAERVRRSATEADVDTLGCKVCMCFVCVCVCVCVSVCLCVLCL